MSITSYRVHPAPAVAWNPQGEPARPRDLDVPSFPQISTVVYTGGGILTTDTSFTVTDDETGQVYGPVTGTGSATYATMLDNAVAALEASSLRNLFIFTENGTTTITFTARHNDRSYTIVATGGPSATAPAVSNTQEPSGPERLSYGFIARGSTARTAAAIGASTEVSDLVGVLHRNEARSLHQLPAVDTDGVELPTITVRRQYDMLPIPYEGTAPTPGDAVYLRRAQTSSAGTVGTLLAAPAGGQQLYTLTPTPSEDSFSVRFSYAGVAYTLVADGADGTYSDAEIVADLQASATSQGIAAATGITFGGTTTLTIQTAAGTALDGAPVSVGQGAFASIVETDAADVDAIDVSSICEVVEVLSGESLALCNVDIRP